MSVESSKARRNQQTDMGELQAEYAKKKKTYARQQEEELDSLKEHYNERKEQARVQGEAAINHIRRKQSSSVEDASEARHKISERSEKQIRSVEEDYRRKMNETQQRRQTQLENARQSSHEKIAEIENNQHEKIEKVRHEAGQELKTVKDRYNKELKQTEAFTEKRLAAVKDSNENAVKNEMERGRHVQEKLQNNLKKDYDTVDTTGKKRIADRNQILETQYQRQDDDYSKRFDKQKDQWVDREASLNDQYHNRIAHSKKAYEQQLKDQHKRFDSTYQKNDLANQKSLRIQSDKLLKEEVELKKQFFKSSEKYAGKEDDPFYKLQERGNRLRENPDFYIIEAYVPAHEKDSIKINIRDNQASISGKRAFVDKIEEDGRKLETNSYQSFREDFAFDKPVITAGMTRERHGDYVHFWVPKLASFDNPAPIKLNKKV